MKIFFDNARNMNTNPLGEIVTVTIDGAQPMKICTKDLHLHKAVQDTAARILEHFGFQKTESNLEAVAAGIYIFIRPKHEQFWVEIENAS